jgi:hypothetical protein
MPKFICRRQTSGPGDLPQEPRGVNFAETSLDRYKAHIENVAVVIPPGTAGEKAGEQRLRSRLHRLPQPGPRRRYRPDQLRGLIRDNTGDEHFTNPRPACRIPSCPPSVSQEDFQRITAFLAP